MADGGDSKKMRFKVYVRSRPAGLDNPNGVVQPEHRVVYLRDPEKKAQDSEFVFDRVFDADTQQAAVFQEVAAPLVDHALQGYNACCFAYGQTGAGKTYSMLGREGGSVGGAYDNGSWGIIPRSCDLLWNAVSQVNGSGAGGNTKIKVFVSFMEVHLEQIRDLGAAAQAHRKQKEPGRAAGATFSLAPSMDGSAPSLRPSASSGQVGLLRDAADYAKGNLEVIEDASGMTVVKDLTYVEVKSLEDMLAVARAGYAVRSAAANDTSSLSHACFTISVVQYRGGAQPVTGRLNLVDLAGSERQAKGGPEPLRAKESRAASASLAALGKVITTLSQSRTEGGNRFSFGGGPPAPVQVSFRDSKLTRVLKDSLTGNSLTVLLACLHPAPDQYEECAATLQFAARCSSSASVPTNGRAAAPGGLSQEGVVEELVMQVGGLREELEATHAHYQKLLESVAGPAWRNDPGPVERAHGTGPDPLLAAPGLFGFTPAPPTPLAIGAAGAIGASFTAGAAGSAAMMDDWRRPSMIGVPGGGRTTDNGGISRPSNRVSNGRDAAGGINVKNNTVLEAQVRKLESQLAQARQLAAQYEERLTSRKEEMNSAREKMANKEHAQFSEIKKLRVQVAELSKAVDAERVDATNRVEDARRRGEEEVARLLKDIDTMRQQFAQVTGSVGSLVEKHSEAVAVEKRQREAARKQADQALRQVAVRSAEEHKLQVDNLKQQSTYFISRQSEQLAEARQQLEAVKATAAAEHAALQAELDYLALYAERVTEVVRRMETGCVPQMDRGNGLKAFKLPMRERPPRLDGERLKVLSARSAEMADRLLALSGATASGPPSPRMASFSAGSASAFLQGSGPNMAHGSVPSATGPSGRNGGSDMGQMGLGMPQGAVVDLDVLRAQWEAEYKAQVTAQVLGDMRSEKTVEYIRGLESQIGRYRVEVQAEKKRCSDMSVALRAVQRAQARPDSPLNRAIAAHSPAGTLTRSPTWGPGHGGSASFTGSPSRPGTATSMMMSLSGRHSLQARPGTAFSMLTSSFRDNGIAIP